MSLASPMAGVDVEDAAGSGAANSGLGLAKKACVWQVISIPFFAGAAVSIAIAGRYSPSAPPLLSGSFDIHGAIWLMSALCLAEAVLQGFLAASVWLADRARGPSDEFRDENFLSDKWDEHTPRLVPVFSLACHFTALTIVPVCRLLLCCYCFRAWAMLPVVLGVGALLSILFVHTTITWKQPALKLSMGIFGLAPLLCGIGFFSAAMNPLVNESAASLATCGLGQLLYVSIFALPACGFKRWQLEILNIPIWLVFAAGATRL